MELPSKHNRATTKNNELVRNNHKPSKAPLIISIIALCLGLASATFAGYLYATQPQRINSYVQAHKNELKGDKGDNGDIGPRGFSGANGSNGSNSYSPTHCSTYGFGDYASTNCY
jgi:hypothetical protein